MKKFTALFLIFILFSLKLFAVPPALEEQFGPRPLDGVYIEALQTYSNPKNSHLGFSFGVWPLQPYYNGFSIDVNYTYYFDKKIAWEVLHGSYIYTVDTGLTTELADTYQVDPKSIQRVNYVVSSNFLLTLAYGKYIFFSDNIRYFRSHFILGPALIATNQASEVGACLGWNFETFVNERVSWKIDLRDNYAFNSTHPNNLVLSLGTSYGF